MIVYEADARRIQNYMQNQEKFRNLEKFSAIDTKSYENFINVSKQAVYNKHVCESFIANCISTGMYGALGCMLSHIYAWNRCDNWLLVLEDDVNVESEDIDELISTLITEAEENDSNFIQLFCNPHFYDEQKKQSQVSQNLYKMIPQWHLCSYLINRKGVDTLKNFMPCPLAVDNFLMKYLNHLNASAYLGSEFVNLGAMNSYDKTSPMGSLLYNYPATM